MPVPCYNDCDDEPAPMLRVLILQQLPAKQMSSGSIRENLMKASMLSHTNLRDVIAIQFVQMRRMRTENISVSAYAI